MSESIGYTPGTGAQIAVDDVGGVLVQRVKATFGADGTATDVSAADPLPVGVVGTVPVSLASAPLPTGAATEATLATLAGAVALEDTPSPGGEPGFVILAQRRDSDAAATSADGDYATLKMDEAGRLKTASQPASYAAITGTITANGQTVFANVQRISNLMLQMATSALSNSNVTFEGSLNSTNGTDGNWFGVQAVRSNANTIELTTGNLSATPAYGWEVSVNGLNWFRIRATAHTSGTANWTFQPASYATEPIPAAQVSATQPVSGTVTLGAGTALAADVGLQVRANATGAATIHHVVSAATTNVAQIKATAGRVYGYCFSNTNAAWRYVKFHNIASATAGAGVVMTVGVPPNGKAECIIPMGLAFTTAISRSIVTGAADTDATAVGLNDIVGDVFFA